MQQETKKSFIRKHLDGDYSLGRAYWVNLVLLSTLVNVVLLAASESIPDTWTAQQISIAILSFLVSGTFVWGWGVWGAWMSAARHAEKGGKRGWATTAKVFLVIGILRTIAELTTYSSVFYEHLDTALGTQPGPEAAVLIRADGRSIQFSGGINDGAAAELEAALELAPFVDTVVFDSTGGWINEGVKLAELITSMGLNTYVEGECSSACTIAFIAGNNRSAEPNAKIGFHSSRAVGDVNEYFSDDINEELFEAYRQAGVSEAFILRALDTSSDQMWYPSYEELVEANVITERSLGGRFSSLGDTIRTREELEYHFRGNDVLAALSERFPEHHERAISGIWVEIQKGSSKAAAFAATRNVIVELFDELLPNAPDALITDFISMALEQAVAISQRDQVACAEYVFSTGAEVDFSAFLPPDLLQEESLILERLILETGKASTTPLSLVSEDEAIEWVLRGLTPEQILVIGDVYNPEIPRVEVCDAALAYFRSLDAIPSEKQGPVFRTMTRIQ